MTSFFTTTTTTTSSSSSSSADYSSYMAWSINSSSNGTSSEVSKRNELIGSSIEVFGDLLCALGLTIQRLASVSATIEAAETGEEKPAVVPLTNRKWLFGFILWVLAQVLELVALGFASESTVVALGNLILLFNAFFAVFIFGETFTIFPVWKKKKNGGIWWEVKNFFNGLFESDLFTLSLLIVGSVFTVAFAPLISKDEQDAFSAKELAHMWVEFPFVFFISCSLLSLCLFSFRFIKRSQENDGPFVLAAIMAILSSFSVTLTKVVTVMLSKAELLTLPSLFLSFVWVVTLVLQVYLINLGLGRYEQGTFVSMQETLGTSLTIVTGILYFKSYRDFHSVGHFFGFFISVIVLCVGLYIMSHKHSPSVEEIIERSKSQISLNTSGSGTRFSSLFTPPSSTSTSEMENGNNNNNNITESLLPLALDEEEERVLENR